MLRLPDHWVWDSWLADDGDEHHLFFLRASRALLDPERRHGRAAIGHATSRDLRRWTLQPDALVHADSPAWDDRAVWTGSVVHGPNGRWRLFYTGVSDAEEGLVQRIGCAVSEDLVTWTRGDGPMLEADPRWYEKLDLGARATRPGATRTCCAIRTATAGHADHRTRGGSSRTAPATGS